jgi:type II secretory pathway pseudopilin PulG
MRAISSSRAGAANLTLIRQVVLIAILIVVAGAAVYDFQVARPAAENAHKKVEQLADEHIRSSQPPLTAAEVQKALNKKPSFTKKGPNGYVEKYSWISGLPWKSYYIWVVYSAGDTPYFEDVLLNQELPKEQDPDYVAPAPQVPAMPGEPVGVGGPGQQKGASGSQGESKEKGAKEERPSGEAAPGGEGKSSEGKDTSSQPQ